MAASTYGLTGVAFGVPTQTGFVVQSSTKSTKPGVVAEVFDENGKRVHARYDDLTTELTLDMIVNGGTAPVAGSTISFEGIVYEVLSVDLKQANRDFDKISVKAKNSANVSLS